MKVIVMMIMTKKETKEFGATDEATGMGEEKVIRIGEEMVEDRKEMKEEIVGKEQKERGRRQGCGE